MEAVRERGRGGEGRGVRVRRQSPEGALNSAVLSVLL